MIKLKIASKFAYLRENKGLLDKNARRSAEISNILLQNVIARFALNTPWLSLNLVACQY